MEEIAACMTIDKTLAKFTITKPQKLPYIWEMSLYNFMQQNINTSKNVHSYFSYFLATWLLIYSIVSQKSIGYINFYNNVVQAFLGYISH